MSETVSKARHDQPW